MSNERIIFFMPTLQELKDKWFIEFGEEDVFPPQTRHPFKDKRAA
jgi:hypothetical protein